MGETNGPSADLFDPMTTPQADRERWLVLNPTSGTADHTDHVRALAEEHGYHVEETEWAGHAVDLAEIAAEEGADVVAAAGGDGTVHEVVQGLARTDALDTTTLAVVPTGTENIFASNLGIHDAEQAFGVVETGARRYLDVGVTDDDEPFVMSCIAGLPADASVGATDEMKERFGSLAFVISGIQEMATFDGLHIDLSLVVDGEERTWSGDALCTLVGNVRRFTGEGGQANIEDGRFEVVVIEQMPTSNVVAEGIAHRLLGQDTEHVHHFQASQVEIASREGDDIDFSLDGELRSHDGLYLHTYPTALRVCVGPDYDPFVGDT
ncbi:diacylglycerol/lipid kinase family protein [Halomarina litorea]|uniref:diacylglycerol/lipid kinase family protein n=1 Tax=Halomarina litorea TaxID=2961595 RepID=UPI0020C47FBC|nr:diacylglycerol kinase family protein [Halomarina sp. BCD28]